MHSIAHLASGTKIELVHLELHRQIDRRVAGIEADRLDLALELPHDVGGRLGIETRRLEVGRQRHRQHVDLVVRHADRLRVRAAQRQAAGIEVRPHAGVGEAVVQRVGVQAGDALQIRQRRHVHDRHAGLPRLRHRVEQFAHAGRAVLRLLHRQRNEIVVGRVDAGRTGGGHLARQLARSRSRPVLRGP